VARTASTRVSLARLAAALCAVLLGPGVGLGCATSTHHHVAAGNPPLCRDHPALGRTLVVPETAWRGDQKDVAEREAMVVRSLEAVFGALPCGEAEIDPLTEWGDRSEESLLSDLAARGIRTAVLVRMEELGPLVGVTFSLPLLWTSFSEADFRVRVLDVGESRVLLDARVERLRGGPFHVRPASWSEAELTAGLAELLGASLPDDR